MNMTRTILCIALFLGLAAPGAGASLSVVINEVLADPGGLDTNGDGVVSSIQDEFVELANAGALPVELGGWTLSDAIGLRHSFAAGQTILSGGFFTVFGGGAPSGFANAATASSGRLGLNNAGDTIALHDPDGALIDALTYSSSTPGVSLTRYPDGVGEFAGERNTRTG